MRGALIVVVCVWASCGPAGIQHGGTGGGGAGSGGSGGGTGGGGTGGTGGGTGGPTFGDMCNGAGTTVTGVVTAPNGHDPIANALVYVPLATDPFPAHVACELCNMPVDPAAATTTTSATGAFTLDLTNVPAGATVQLTVNMGRFRRVTTLSVTPCGANAASATATTLPGKSASGDDIPKIAVATGNKDQLDVVLAAMGLDAQTASTASRGEPARRAR